MKKIIVCTLKSTRLKLKLPKEKWRMTKEIVINMWARALHTLEKLWEVAMIKGSLLKINGCKWHRGANLPNTIITKIDGNYIAKSTNSVKIGRGTNITSCELGIRIKCLHLRIQTQRTPWITSSFPGLIYIHSYTSIIPVRLGN